MRIKFKGNIVEFNIGKADYARTFGEDVTDSLVQYDPKSNTVTVDERCSAFYAKYAGIHECICCGRYKNIAPYSVDPLMRCANIDKMIIDTMSDVEKKIYASKRIEMFSTLLEKNLNPEMNPQFENSLNMLKSLKIA